MAVPTTIYVKSKIHIDAAKNKVWKVENVPLVYADTNENLLTFEPEELEKSYKTLEGVPLYINLLGEEDNDHATGSSMNTVGHVYNVRYDKKNSTAYADLEVTDPKVGEKLERADTKGVPEIAGVSIGADVNAICSICGKNIDACEHTLGEEYDGKICTVLGRDAVFNHVALTNLPAFPKATFSSEQVMVIAAKYLTKKGDTMKVKKIVRAQLDPDEKEEVKEIVEEKVGDALEKAAEVVQDVAPEVADALNEASGAELPSEEELPVEEQKKKTKSQGEELVPDVDKKEAPAKEELKVNAENPPVSEEKKNKSIEDQVIDLQRENAEIKSSLEEIKILLKGNGDKTEEGLVDKVETKEIEEMKKKLALSQAKVQMFESERKKKLQKAIASLNPEVLKQIDPENLKQLAQTYKILKTVQASQQVHTESRRERYERILRSGRPVVPTHTESSISGNSKEYRKQQAIEAAKKKGSAMALQEAYEAGKR